MLGVCAPSFGLAGLFTEPDTEDETVIGEDDNFFLEQATPAAPSGTDSILIDTNVEQDQWLL
ncbi:hypothetical protein Q3A86_36425 [Streptomyces sp. NBUA17]|uniref:hypothetical protein n=1 Tax=Streptomyces sp. NBUA17 TaxID=3062275 RepID=UPI0037D991FA